jgi:hypothetical protein
MFNLKRHKVVTAEEVAVTEEKQLEGVHDPIDGDEVTQTQLDDVREGDDRDAILEGQLDDVRTSEVDETIEALLDGQADHDTPIRTGEDEHDQLPLNLVITLRTKNATKSTTKKPNRRTLRFGTNTLDSSSSANTPRFR